MQKQTCTPPMSDKTFMRTMVASILGIVLSMLALLSTTWAYFSESVNSQSNVIQAASAFSAEPQVSMLSAQNTYAFGDEALPTFESLDGSRNAYRFEVEGSAVTKYRITLGMDSMTASKAYTTVKVRWVENNEEQYRIYMHEFTQENIDPVDFDISATDGDIIEVVSYWSAYGVPNNTEEIANRNIVTENAAKRMAQAEALYDDILDAVELANDVANQVKADVARAVELTNSVHVEDGEKFSSYLSSLSAYAENAQNIADRADEILSGIGEDKDTAEFVMLVMQNANMTVLEEIWVNIQSAILNINNLQTDICGLIDYISALNEKLKSAIEQQNAVASSASGSASEPAQSSASESEITSSQTSAVESTIAAVTTEPTATVEPEITTTESPEPEEPEITTTEPAEPEEPEITTTESVEPEEPEITTTEPAEPEEPEITTTEPVEPEEPEITTTEPAEPEDPEITITEPNSEGNVVDVLDPAQE